MAELDAYLFGYRYLKADDGSDARLATALLSLGISALRGEDGRFLIREADFRRFRSYAGGRVRYTATEVCGLPARLSGLKRYIAVIAVSLLLCLLSVFLSALVWDVRISGNEHISADELTDALADSGLSVGLFWWDIDPERIENRLLLDNDEIAWVHINRRGTVAYVEVREREGGDGEKESPVACSNIVADRDGVIEEIIVEHGVAMVKKGDTVRRGDVLISGVGENERGTFFVRAEGRVTAHVGDSVTAFARSVEVGEEQGERELASVSLVIFGKSVNIFKKYSNFDDNCVIIEDEEVYLIGDECKLPFSLKREYIVRRESYQMEIPDGDLPTVAGERLAELLASELSGVDLIRITTSGDYTDGGYALTAEYVYAAEIGVESQVDLSGL